MVMKMRGLALSRGRDIAWVGPDPSPHGTGGKDMEKLLLSPTDAAAHLSIGRSKVYELLRLGQLR